MKEIENKSIGHKAMILKRHEDAGAVLNACCILAQGINKSRVSVKQKVAVLEMRKLRYRHHLAVKVLKRDLFSI